MVKNILNIPANYHFFNSLFCFLENSEHKLEDFIIFLPNRRSCRELSNVIAKNKPNIFLPKIKAISDIAYEDFFEIFNCNTAQNQSQLKEELRLIINKLKDLSVNDSLSQTLYIAEQITSINHFGKDVSFLDALKIAGDLSNFFDEIEKKQINSKQVLEIDDFDLSIHRQINLDFLQNFYSKIQNNLIKNNIHSKISYDNLITEEYVSFLKQCLPSRPIVIAGSTGSVSYGRNLIKTIFNLKNGYVITHGLIECPEKLDEKHPQFYINRLRSYLGRAEIYHLKYPKFILSKDSRIDFINNMLDFNLDSHVEADEITNNFCLIEAKNNYEEARIISLIAANQLSLNKSSAIVSSDNELLDLINLELRCNNIEFNDSRNIGVLDNGLVILILEALDLIDNNFDSHSILALLKNQLCKYSQNQEFIKDIELNILRKDRIVRGIEGIKAKLEEHNNPKTKSSFNEFLADLEDLINIAKYKNLARQVESIINTIDKITIEGWVNTLATQNCSDELQNFISKVTLQNPSHSFKDNLTTSFKYLFAQISYFKKTNSKQKIQILSHVESRLMNFDCIIIPSLNQDSFPEKYEYKWLGKKIKQQLDIDDKLKNLGQNSFSFANYLGNPKIFLTRHKAKDGKISLESIFIIKFKIICKKHNLIIDRAESFLKKIDHEKNIKANPKIYKALPPFNQRIKEISATDITKLIQNPYRIYAKKILKLKEINRIDYKPQNREFGIFVHKILEDLVKEKKYQENQELFFQNTKKTFKEYFKSQDSEIIWLPRIENIIKNFYCENQKLKNLSNYTEILTEMMISDYKIICRIDRIVKDNQNQIKIIDYKTGNPPTKQKVTLGLDPQLTLSALSLIEGSIKGHPDLKPKLTEIESIIYWKISSFTSGSINNIIKNKDELEGAIIQAKEGVKRLLDYFSNENQPFIAKKSDYLDQYWHLSRYES